MHARTYSRTSPWHALGLLLVDRERYLRSAAEHGIAVHELSPREASLEAAYLELTGDSVDFRVEVGAS